MPEVSAAGATVVGSGPRRWTSWSGLAESRPAAWASPASEAEVVEAVLGARASGLRVKMVGSGHSFTDVAGTDGLLLDPGRLRGLVEVDREALRVTVLAGTPLHELNATLASLGLALHNLGDIDRQTVAGAVSTGTHGTGGVTASLAGQLEGLTLVTGDGTVLTASRTENADVFDAARVGLGALGVLTTLTFAVEPAFTLLADERPASWDEAIEGYDALAAAHQHVDLYWFPHTDRCLVKTNDRTLDDPEPLSRWRAWVDDELLSNTLFGLVDAACTRAPKITRRVNAVTSRLLSARSYSDASAKVFIAPRRVRFREMEYSVPREAGLAALTEIRALVERSDWQLPWPVEVRQTPPDEAWLSTTYGRESMYLAFHVGARVDHRPYFTAVESVLRKLDGRPHWGKLHTRTAEDLAPAYPRWRAFAEVRDRLDPDRLFTNPYLDRVLG